MISEGRLQPKLPTEQEVKYFIDKLHFCTYDHVKKKVLELFPDVSKEKLKQIVKRRLKDKFIKVRNIAPYYVHIFSTQPNCWFHDLMDNLSGNEPRYWHIFIGTNNHYAVALPLENKSAASVR